MIGSERYVIKEVVRTGKEGDLNMIVLGIA